MIYHGCRRVCQYCEKTMGFKEGEDGTVTHGICPDCLSEPYRREALCHVISCRVCGVVSFHIDDVLPRCDEGKDLVAKWARAREAARRL